MGIFEDFFVKAKSAFEIVGAKAGRFIDVSKLKIDIADLENKKRSEFEKIGRLFYQQNKKGCEKCDKDEDLIGASFARIENLEARISKIYEEVDLIKNKIVCNSCNSRNDKKSSYCSKCGEGLSVTRDENCSNKDSSCDKGQKKCKDREFSCGNSKSVGNSLEDSNN
ncbi:MAG: hypothetical protein CfP315_0449 [Candidatus Improbicoccus pseudotrichonymphae]|uniref:Zinc ribbon domain-containing protein n=1 Tax=Candidatus Improbicoccus pseudotrichonymphae TaxID=3033792 RepID=A0AA48KYI5_9FIRM|nr:MAG: hypothetical protein CfP315_0449 [Candidatus Improbicoccus pseudotrichonymphae]